MKQAATCPNGAHRALRSARLTIVARAVTAVLGMSAAGAAGLPAQAGSPAGPVPVDMLERRRAALLDSIGRGIVILRSAEARSVESDYPQDSDYREDNDFFYLTGLEAPGGWLVMGRGPDQSVIRLYLPPRNPRMEQWTGRMLGPGVEAERLTGIADVRPSTYLRQDLSDLLHEMSSEAPVYASMALPESSCFDSMIDVDACFPSLAGLELAAANIRGIDATMAQLRLAKDDDELRRMRKAIEITAAAQLESMRALEPGLHEYAIEALIEYTFRRSGAERVGFPSIVGSGPNSTVLHYDENRRLMSDGDLVVIDIGAEYGYYSADITRTYPVSGRFSARQRAIYELVLGTQQAAIDAVRPGVTIADLTGIAHDYLDRFSGDLCGGSSCGRFFIHGLSHWLGMDVHDVGAYSTPLAPGMVLTIEPGIYIAAEGLGVRIEDDVLVTENGCQVLSAAVPRSADEVERIITDAYESRAAARERE